VARESLLQLLRRGYLSWRVADLRKIPFPEALLLDRRGTPLPALDGVRRVGPRPPSPPPSRVRIAIVGAGLAGLTCCHRLAQAGWVAQVYEASDRVGGRVWTERDAWGDGTLIERGAELVSSSDHEVLALCDELGLARIDLWEDYRGPRPLDASVWWVGGRRWSADQAAAELAPVYRAVQDMADALPPWSSLTWQTADEVAQRFDRIPVPRFLEDAGVSSAARAMVAASVGSEYGYEVDRMSALVLLQALGIGDNVDWDERYKLVGGLDRLPRGLAARYDDRIHLDRALRAVTVGSDGRYHLHFDKEEVVADAVVLAVPFTVLRGVDLRIELSPPKADAIRRLTYGTNAKLFVRFREPFWRREGLDGYALTDTGSQVAWDEGQGVGNRCGVLVNYAFGAHGVAIGSVDPALTAARLREDLRPLFPDIVDQDTGHPPILQHWPSEPTAFASYSGYGIGEWTAFRGAEGTPEGGVFFAGEHTSLRDQGYLNGAAESGARAAREVAAWLGGRVEAVEAPAGRSRAS
jgi:monoamine oxidase